MKIQLSEIPGIDQTSVVRDVAISSTGLLTGDGQDMLAALHDGAFLNDLLQARSIAAVVTSPDLSSRVPENLGLVVSDDPVAIFLDLHEALAGIDGFFRTWKPNEIHADAVIHQTAWIAEENVKISAGVSIGPNATILENVSIAEGCVIHPGAVIGTDGFHIETAAGKPRSVRHAGRVVLGKNVEVQASTNIARSIFGGATSIGADTKIGGHCQIGHAVRIGQRCHIRPSTLISGSTTIGDDVWIAAGCRISNSIHIGDGVAIMFAETVTRSVPDGVAFAKGRFAKKDQLLGKLKKIKIHRPREE
jgi:UDP-3-O-[3-hydroxymyristoyl] glucosamine N-acyltransferase